MLPKETVDRIEKNKKRLKNAVSVREKLIVLSDFSKEYDNLTGVSDKNEFRKLVKYSSEKALSEIGVSIFID